MSKETVKNKNNTSRNMIRKNMKSELKSPFTKGIGFLLKGLSKCLISYKYPLFELIRLKSNVLISLLKLISYCFLFLPNLAMYMLTSGY